MKFGTDGVRGVANTDLTAAFALDLGRAAARVLGGTEAVVGGDTRVSTAMLEAAFVAGLASEGVVVHRLGVVPTPVVAFEAARRDCLGAMISASHNPYRDNGIKLFARGGTKLPDDVEERIEADVLGAAAARRRAGPAGRRRGQPGLPRPRARRRSRAAGSTGCASSSTPPTAPPAASPAAVRGRRRRRRSSSTPSPTAATSTPAAGPRTRRRWPRPCVEHGADLGLALDGDADRLLAVDHTGALVDGDHMHRHLRARHACPWRAARRHRRRDGDDEPRVPAGDGGRPASTSSSPPSATATCWRRSTPARYSLGGEQSGHVIFRDLATTGDGLLTGVILGDAVRRSGRPLADAGRGGDDPAARRCSSTCRSRRPMPDAAERVADEIAEVEAELGGRGRVLVRPSGTEPLVRVMVEAPTQDQADAGAETIAGRGRGPPADPDAARVGRVPVSSLSLHVRHRRHRQPSPDPSDADARRAARRARRRAGRPR